jgi:hypothetical protein
VLVVLINVCRRLISIFFSSTRRLLINMCLNLLYYKKSFVKKIFEKLVLPHVCIKKRFIYLICEKKRFSTDMKKKSLSSMNIPAPSPSVIKWLESCN